MSNFFLSLFGVGKQKTIPQMLELEQDMERQLHRTDQKILAEYYIAGRAVSESDQPTARKAWKRAAKLKEERRNTSDRLTNLKDTRRKLESESECQTVSVRQSTEPVALVESDSDSSLNGNGISELVNALVNQCGLEVQENVVNGNICSSSGAANGLEPGKSESESVLGLKRQESIYNLPDSGENNNRDREPGPVASGSRTTKLSDVILRQVC